MPQSTNLFQSFSLTLVSWSAQLAKLAFSRELQAHDVAVRSKRAFTVVISKGYSSIPLLHLEPARTSLDSPLTWSYPTSQPSPTSGTTGKA